MSDSKRPGSDSTRRGAAAERRWGVSDDRMITVTMPAAAARDLLNDAGGYRALDAMKAALAEHDAAINPQKLPWRAAKNPNHGWSVLDCNGHVLAPVLTEAQARLMAAAPELADLVARFRAFFNEPWWSDQTLTDDIEAALTKAGRR